ncbi:MAG: hypothetical protein H0X27_09930 [Caulobacteraceae bacterium]|nr:hypothetical protein [Caulobacteraceae bacterium]
MTDETTALMVVKGDRAAPSLADAAGQLHLKIDDLDAGFGVVTIDPDRGLYSVRVRADRVEACESPDYRGPFSDPRIEVGPVR